MNNKILLFTSETAPSFAGDGRNALLFAKTLNELGHKVAICCMNPAGLLPDNEEIDGIEVFRVKYFHRSLFGRLLSRDILAHFLVKSGRLYNVWVVYGAMPGYQLILFLGKLQRRKVVFRSTLAGFDDINSLGAAKNQLSNAINKYLLSGVFGYFALNSFFADTWKSFFGNQFPKIFLSSQGVDINRFSPVNSSEKAEIREKLGLPHAKLILLTVGHLTKRKGFVELFHWLNKVPKDYCLIHVGRKKAPDWDALSGKNREMEENFQKGMELLGNKLILVEATENIDDYYKAADIFILSSFSEGNSNTLNEAMSSGLPVLTRNIQGCKDYLDDGVNGLIYSNPSEFTQKLINLLKDGILRHELGSNARLMAIERLNVKNVAERFVEFLSA